MKCIVLVLACGVGRCLGATVVDVVTEIDERVTEHGGEAAATMRSEMDAYQVWAEADASPVAKARRERLKLYWDWTVRFGYGTGSDDTRVVTPARIEQRIEQIPFYVRRGASPTPLGMGRSVEERLWRVPNGGLLVEVPNEVILGADLGFLQELEPRAVLDGVSVVDPYRGTALWYLLPRNVFRLEVVEGGGATAWGDGASRGVVQVISEPSIGRLSRVSEKEREWTGETRVLVGGGTNGSFVAEIARNEPTPWGILGIEAGYVSAGSYGYLEDRSRDQVGRGDQRRLRMRWRQLVGEDMELAASFGVYDSLHSHEGISSERSRSLLGSIALRKAPSLELTWNALAYAYENHYSSYSLLDDSGTAGSSSVLDTELDPNVAIGAAWGGVWWSQDGNGRTNIGLDIRESRGRSRERLRAQGGVDVSARSSDGERWDGGAYIMRHQRIGRGLYISMGVRREVVRTSNGEIRGGGKVGGSVDVIEGREKWLWLPMIGGVWKWGRGGQVRMTVQRGSNEASMSALYERRAYRGELMEANGALRGEESWRTEIGAEWTSSRYEGRIEIRGIVTSLKDAMVVSREWTMEGTSKPLWKRHNMDAVVKAIKVCGEVEIGDGVVLEATLLWSGIHTAGTPYNRVGLERCYRKTTGDVVLKGRVSENVEIMCGVRGPIFRDYADKEWDDIYSVVNAWWGVNIALANSAEVFMNVAERLSRTAGRDRIDCMVGIRSAW